jgi:hypothetical protein
VDGLAVVTTSASVPRVPLGGLWGLGVLGGGILRVGPLARSGFSPASSKDSDDSMGLSTAARAYWRSIERAGLGGSDESRVSSDEADSSDSSEEWSGGDGDDEGDGSGDDDDDGEGDGDDSGGDGSDGGSGSDDDNDGGDGGSKGDGGGGSNGGKASAVAPLV